MTSGGDVVPSPLSKVVQTESLSAMEAGRVLSGALLQLWTWLTRHSRSVLNRRVSRRLSVSETVSFGEKRFVSILQIDREQFLIGGSSTNIVLLAKLEEKPELPGESSFESVFSRMGSGAAVGEIDDKKPAGATR